MLESQNMEGSAMIANKGIDQKANTTDNKRTDRSKASNCDNKDNLWCTYYQKPRYTQEKCWKLHGKLITSSKEWGYNGGQQRDNGQAQLSSVQPLEEKYLEQGGFNREEIENLSALLGTLEKISSTYSLTLFSKFPISIGLKVLDETLLVLGFQIQVS